MRIPRHSIAPGFLSLREIDRLVGELPAEARAAVAWVAPELRAAVGRLTSGRPDFETIRAVAAELVVATHAVWPPLVRLFGGHAALRAEIEEISRRILVKLQAHLEDAVAQHAAEWALRATLRMFDFVVVVDRSEFEVALEAIDGDELRKFAGSDAAALLRAQMLLLAATELAEEGRDPALARELALLAYREARLGVATARSLGVELDPHAGETPQERSRRLLAYADAARSALDEDDEAVLASARMGDLR